MADSERALPVDRRECGGDLRGYVRTEAELARAAEECRALSEYARERRERAASERAARSGN